MTQPPDGAAPERPRGRRIDDIEVLRALAIGMVLVQHAPVHLVPFLAADRGAVYGRFGFWSGVDLFFAISGFVIARSLLPSLAAARDRRAFLGAALGFWVRRAWRLLPSAWLWGAGLLVLAAGFNRSGTFGPFHTVAAGVVAAVLQVANFRLVWTHGLTIHNPTAVYWTLSLEEQFYLVLPALVFIARSRLPAVLALVALAQLFLPRTGPHGSALLNATRSDALALGVMLAMWSGAGSYRKLEPAWLARGPWRWMLAPTFLALFAGATSPSSGLGGFTVGALALLAAGIVWIASYDRDYLWPAGRLKRVMCWVGARSYALYLIHLPANHAAVEFWWRVDPRMLTASWPHLAVLLATAAPVTLGLAELNYRLVENPLRRHGARVAERLMRNGAGTGGAAVRAAA